MSNNSNLFGGLKSIYRFFTFSLVAVMVFGSFPAITALNLVAQNVDEYSDLPEVTSSNGIEPYQNPIEGQDPIYSRSQGQFQNNDLQPLYINMKAGIFDPLISRPDFPVKLTYDRPNGYYLVQFAGPIHPEWFEKMQGNGAVVFGYIPDFTYLVHMNLETSGRINKLPYVRWVGIYHPVYKLPDGLLEKTQDIELDIVVFTDNKENLNLVTGEIRQMGGEILASGIDNYIIRVKIDAQKILDIALLPQVEWIDEYTPPVALMNHVRVFTGAETVYIDGFNGTGVVGEVKDNGIDQGHPDFIGQLIGTDGNPSDGDHGTACFGIVFSSGANNQIAQGMMPGGEGVFCDWGVGRKTSINNLVNIWGGVFQSNSWHMTGQTDGTYNSNSRRNDEAVFENDVTMLYAAGNSNNGVYPSSISTDAAAKNIITVGAVYHYNDEIRSNDQWVNWGPGATPSQGPASDGRIKPDLAGVFDSIYTTDSVDGDGEDGYASGNYYSNFGGTSGATPIVAGAVGIAYQMYKEDLFGNNPSGSLPAASTIKALMIADAYQYEFFQANRYQQGWGLADLENTYNIGKNHFIVDQDVSLQTGEYINYTVAPTFDGPMKISLVWTDVPGTTSSSQHLINNLDLTVVDPDGTKYFGNYGLDNSKWSQSGGAADSLNNVENVFIENPVPGKWTISVAASNIALDGNVQTPQLDQHFSIVGGNVAQSLHDLGVSGLVAPDYAAPGVSETISAFVYNNGLDVENDILVNLTIDGTVFDNRVISALASGDSTPINFEWIPTTGIFMVGIEVEVVPEENLTINNIQKKIVIAEPDTAVVGMSAPRFSPPGAVVTVNATAANLGRVDLNNVQVQLLVNGTIEDSKIISNLQEEKQQNISFSWTPFSEGWFQLEVYVVPHNDESMILDNRQNSSIFITSDDPVIVMIVDSWGTDSSSEAPWEYINSNWIEFGTKPVLIDYDTLDRDHFTYEDIVTADPDVLFISGAYLQEYSTSEIEAISDYVMGGAGLVATSVTFYQSVPNNNKLAYLFGMRDDLTYDADFTPSLDVLDPAHPLFVNVPDPYSVGSQITASPSDLTWNTGDIIDGTYIAKSQDDMGAIITHKGVVYISSWVEYQSNLDDMQLLYNSMTWTKWERDLHDISVSNISAPRYIDPQDQVSVSATVLNVGLSDETDVVVSFYVDGNLYDEIIIPSLASGSKVPVDFIWDAPVSENVYTLKIEAASLSMENITMNNLAETEVVVSWGPVSGSIGLISDASQLGSITSILDDLSKTYVSYNDNSQNKYTSDIMLLLQHEMVIFYNHNRVIDSAEHEALMDYLELGGKLVVTGFDSLGAPDDPLMAEIVRSTSVGDNMGEGTFSVTDPLHPIMNGIFGQFSQGSTYSITQTDHDNAEADLTKGAQTIAELNDGYDKIIATELSSGGKVIYWNGNRNCDDWLAEDTEDMFKNLIVWIMPIYEDVGILTSQIPSVVFVNETADILATVINLGLNDSAGFDVLLEIRDSYGLTVESRLRTINPLSHLQTSDLNWQWVTHLSGQYLVNITILVQDDEIPGNNEVSNQLIVYYKFFGDDMEGGANSWTSSASTLSPLWHQTTTESYSPTTSWWCGMDSSTQYTVLGEQYLTSPVIDLVDATEAYMSFHHKFSIDDYLIGGNWGFVEINPDGSGWITLDYYGMFNQGWEQVTLDLASYMGSLVQVRFHLSSQVVLTDNGWWVDDVLIYGLANQFGVELSVDVNSASSGRTDPGYYDLYVKNTGNILSDLDLDLTGGETQKWQYVFTPDTFSLLPESTMLVNVSVLPSQTEAGDYIFSVLGQAGSGGVNKAQDSEDLFITVTPWYEVDMEITTNLLNLMPGESNHIDIKITNNGNTFDTISLDLFSTSFGTSSSWNLRLSMEFLQLKSYESENVTLTVFAPLDGVKGDYLDMNLTAYSFGNSSEYAKGQTTAQIAEFYLLDIRSQQSVKGTEPNIPVEYDIKVVNLGNTPVTIDMDIFPVGNWNGWSSLFDDANFIVGAYSIENVTLTITSPGNLLENEFKEFNVQASSIFNVSSLTVKTIIDRSGDINVFVHENSQDAELMETVYYEFTVSNTQNTNDTVDVRAVSKNGWDINILRWDKKSQLNDSDSDGKPDTGLLEPWDDDEDIVVSVEVPPDVKVSIQDRITVTFYSSLTNGSEISMDVKVTVKASGRVSLEALSYSGSAVSGSQINYWITVDNYFNYDTAFDITLILKYNWQYELYFGDGTSSLMDSNQNGIPDSGKLDAFDGTADIMIVILIPEDAVAETANKVTVQASTIDHGGGQKSIILNATVDRIYDFEIEMVDEKDLKAEPGSELEFIVRISNNGNFEEHMDMRFGELPFGWRGYYSNSEPQVPIGSSKTVTVTIEVPDDADAGDHTVFIRGISDDGVYSNDLLVSITVSEKEEGMQLSLILLLLLFVVIIVMVAVVTMRRRGKTVGAKMVYPAQMTAQKAPRTQAEAYVSQQPVQVVSQARYQQQVGYSQGAYGSPVFPSFETIKCPACYHPFEVETGIRPARVQCPKCGIRGTIR